MADSAWSVLAGGATTLAGAALSAWVAAKREDRSWQRQSLTRWDRDKFEIYTQFLVWLGNAATAVSQVQIDLLESKLDDVAVRDAREHYRETRRELWHMYQQVELVGSNDISTYAWTAYDAIVDLRRLGSEGHSVHTSDWKATHKRMDDARAAFRKAVARELRIPSKWSEALSE